MKILCIQLARLGDILLSAPALHALKREYPDSQIDILVRPRFEDAAKLFESWMNVKTLDTAGILGPVVNDGNLESSLSQLNSLVGSLRAENYDLVLNFTFSAFSSYLTKLVSDENSRGYSRFSDGSFAITDFISGYFYSQVGIGRPNRIHLSDIFAAMAGAALDLSDWNLIPRAQNPKGLVLHVGASQSTKALSVDKLVMIVSSLQERGFSEITLVGSAQETPIANQISARVDGAVKNLCGRTTIKELAATIAAAEIVIGADSAPMHFATLSGVPCLNLTFPTVNFFETGPRSVGSRILFSDSGDQLLSHIVANEADGIVKGRSPALCVAESQSPTEAYYCPRWKRLDTEWSIIKSAYFRVPFENQLTEQEALGIKQIKSLNQILIEQYQHLEQKSENNWASDFIHKAEVLFATIAQAVPSLQVLVRWAQASRAAVGPDSNQIILQQYKTIHVDLAGILDEIVPPEEKAHGNENLPVD